MTRVKRYSAGSCSNRLHHIYRKVPGRLVDFPAGCLLIEHNEDFYLVDTGYGEGILENHWKCRIYRRLNPPHYTRQDSLAYQLGQSGVELSRLKAIILTHLHPDHIGGLRDFPKLPVIVSEQAAQQLKQGSLLLFRHLLPRDIQSRLQSVVLKEMSPLEGFTGTDLFKDGSLWLIDLPGHAAGHMGVYLPQGHLFFIADAAWGLEYMHKILRWIPRLIQHDYSLYKESLNKIRALQLNDPTLRIWTTHGQNEVSLD